MTRKDFEKAKAISKDLKTVESKLIDIENNNGVPRNPYVELIGSELHINYLNSVKYALEGLHRALKAEFAKLGNGNAQ